MVNARGRTLISFGIVVTLTVTVFTVVAFSRTQPLLQGICIGVVATILGSCILMGYQLLYGVNEMIVAPVRELLERKFTLLQELHVQGLVRAVAGRVQLGLRFWPDLNERVTKRYWTCGTSLRTLAAERDVLENMIKKGVDIRIVLPSTSKSDNSCRQLEEFDILSIDSQVNAAEKSKTGIKKLLSDHNREDCLKAYPGIMYANITIYDDTAIIAFYGIGGVGHDNYTLVFDGKESAGYKYAVKEFERVWGS